MNKTRKEEVLMDIIQTDVENAEDMLNGINEKDEKKCLTEFYKKIIESSTSVGGFTTVAGSIINQLKDDEWGRKIYELAVEKAKDSGNYLGIAYSYVRCLDDKKTAKKLCKKAVEIAKKSKDYISIADFELNYFDDTSNLSDYYSKAEQLSKDDPYEYYKVGIAILANTSDAERGAKIISKALEIICEVGFLCVVYDELDLVSVSDTDCDFLKDELLDEIREKIMDEACGVDDYIEIAENLFTLEDEALEEAESAASDVDEYLQLAEYYGSNDESKAQEFCEKALEEADPNDPEEMKKVKEAMQ